MHLTVSRFAVAAIAAITLLSALPRLRARINRPMRPPLRRRRTRSPKPSKRPAGNCCSTARRSTAGTLSASKTCSARLEREGRHAGLRRSAQRRRHRHQATNSVGSSSISITTFPRPATAASCITSPTPARHVWETGPEFQLEDNEKAADPIRCGWLYALYQPPIDPKTGKTLDATKPVGEWNHVRLVITPEKCEHYINGVKYFEYVLGSDDFKARVAKSKFARMKNFAKSDTGYIALQGDHGQIAFRNIKIRPIEAKP